MTPGSRSLGAGVSGEPCPDGSAVESGLQPNTVKLYRAVCAAFPAVSAWGGLSGSGGDHGVGRALDIMSTGSLRDAIAIYVRSHACRVRRELRHQGTAHLVGGAQQRGLARHGGPWVNDGQPLRPRARVPLLTRVGRTHDAKSGMFPRAESLRPFGSSQSSCRPRAVRSRK